MVKKQDYSKLTDLVTIEACLTPQYALGMEKEKAFFLGNIVRNQGPLQILDVGCGNGRLTKELALYVGGFGKVLGIDNNSNQLKKANRVSTYFSNIDLKEFDAENMADLENDFDYVIFSFGVLGQMEKREAATILNGTKQRLKQELSSKVLATFFRETASPLQIEEYMLVGGRNFSLSPEKLVFEDINHTTMRYSKNQIKELFLEAGFKAEVHKLCPLYYGVIAR